MKKLVEIDPSRLDLYVEHTRKHIHIHTHPRTSTYNFIYKLTVLKIVTQFKVFWN